MRRLLGFVTLLVLVGSLTALAGSDENHPEFWGDDCFKIDESFGDSWIADDDYRLVVAKAGQTNYQYHNVSKGDVIDPPQDISHLILCTEVPSSSTTTSTIRTSTSTSTTILNGSTTTTSGISTTLTDSTSSTVQPSTTIPETTTTLETTTTVEEETTTTVEVSETTLTTIPTQPTTTLTTPSTTEPPKDLPLTGANLAILLTLGGLVTTMGVLLVRRSRGREH